MVCSWSQGNISGRMFRTLRLSIACSAFAFAVAPAYAQLSFFTAVTLSLKSNPKVLTAQADVDKALATLQQLRDAYIPNIVGGSGIGTPHYCYPLGQPPHSTLTLTPFVLSSMHQTHIPVA